MTASESNRHVHFERLHNAPTKRWYVRFAARCFCHTLVGMFGFVTALFSGCRRRREGSGRTRRGAARIVVTGTFFADNWVEAHIRPLAAAGRCAHVWVVSDRRFVPMDNVTYVCPPKWLQRLIGRIPSRSAIFVVTAFLKRADVVGGFHLLCNGLLALMVARMVGARAMYFCVGGWAEFAAGGVHGGNRTFTLIAHGDKPLEGALFRAVRQFDLILTMGTGAKAYLERCDVGAPIEVMPGGMDARAHPQANGRKRNYDLVTVSRIASVKRIDVLLNVVHRVAQSVPTVKLAVVGDGELLDSLKKLAADLNIVDNVDFVGRRSDVPRWLADSKLFVLTSDSEGLSLALMEAMTAGLPAVVSDVGDLGDLVGDGVNGWRPPPRDVEAFAERITNLLTDQELYRRFAHEARHAAAELSVHVMIDRWDAILGRWSFGNARSPAITSQPRKRLAWPNRKRIWETSRWATRHPSARFLSAVKPSTWLGRRFRRNLEFVESSETWSADEAYAFQFKKVREVIALAYERSPYYRQVFRACGFEPGDLRSLEDMRKLPCIDADTVRNNLAGITTSGHTAHASELISTGGTGGRPLRFLIGPGRSVSEYAHLIASWQRAGYRTDLPMAVFRGWLVAPDRNGLRHEYDPLLRHHRYSVFHMSDENMRRYLEHVRSIGPCFLHVYPSSIFMLARFLQRTGVEAPSNIRGIIAESEITYPSQRQLVEELFGCRYFSCYGHTEKLVAAAECEHSTDYHVWPTYGYFELLDDEGRPVTTPGKRGEIVGTGFMNTVMPFIRYRTGDHATYVSDHCEACGRQHTIIRDIRGHRTQETLLAKDGSLIAWAALNMHDDTFENVMQYQFRQERPGVATLSVVPTPAFCEVDRRRILANLAKRLDGQLDVSIQLTKSIPLSQRGKAVYVDQRLSAADELDAQRLLAKHVT